jgi:hypothetical protein
MEPNPLCSTPYDPADNNVFDPHIVRAETRDHTADPIPADDSSIEQDTLSPLSNPADRPRITPIQPYAKGGYGLINGSASDNSSISSVSKHYNHHESRKFILWVGFIRFFATLFFCILIALSLRAFEGFNVPRVLSKPEIRAFNAIMLGLSLGLGFNLSSSLKHYAVILRWSILTKRYVSLEVFDLILGCEALTNVLKLMIISIPGAWKFPVLRKMPWFREARRDGDHITWIVCFVWLTINIAVQVLVALLSLFWPIDPSTSVLLLAHGDISVSNLATWDPSPPVPGNSSQLAVANSFGYEAFRYQIANISETKAPKDPRKTIYKGDGFHEYRFLNQNPRDPSNSYLVSSRKVRTEVKCEELYSRGDFVTGNDTMYANSSRDLKTWEYFPLPTYVRGSITWISSRAAHCGPRCTNLTVYQHHDLPNGDIKASSMWLCNSTVLPITWNPKDIRNIQKGDEVALRGTDDFARIAAGAIGWTGYTMNGYRSRQSRVYPAGVHWSPYKIVKPNEIEDYISLYSTGAIAAFDDHGPKYRLRNQNRLPVQGQQLNADWSWIFSILTGICVIQFGVVVTLIAFANKGIIRDESSFSLAMLLSPVINRVGKGGMNLSGDEIKNHPNLMWKRIRYDYRDGKGAEPNQVDIFFQGRDQIEARRSWVDGEYS